MKLRVIAVAGLAALVSFPSVAADIAAGKAKSAVCAACHGPEGISFIPTYPNLAGQKAAYTYKQLKDFKEKRRKDPVMIAQSAGLSDEDMKNIAAYYESLGKK